MRLACQVRTAVRAPAESGGTCGPCSERRLLVLPLPQVRILPQGEEESTDDVDDTVHGGGGGGCASPPALTVAVQKVDLPDDFLDH